MHVLISEVASFQRHYSRGGGGGFKFVKVVVLMNFQSGHVHLRGTNLIAERSLKGGWLTKNQNGNESPKAWH